jgi:hypothetical protein
VDADWGASASSWLRPQRVVRCIKRTLRVPFAMKIIIIMCWRIWTSRNSWLFKDEDATIEKNAKILSRRSSPWLFIDQRKDMSQMWRFSCRT